MAPQPGTDYPRHFDRQLWLSSFKRQLKIYSVPVPALDSAGCSCAGCRVPSSGAVVTVQRVRRPPTTNVQTRLKSLACLFVIICKCLDFVEKINICDFIVQWFLKWAVRHLGILKIQLCKTHFAKFCGDKPLPKYGDSTNSKWRLSAILDFHRFEIITRPHSITASAHFPSL